MYDNFLSKTRNFNLKPWTIDAFFHNPRITSVTKARVFPFNDKNNIIDILRSCPQIRAILSGWRWMSKTQLAQVRIIGQSSTSSSSSSYQKKLQEEQVICSLWRTNKSQKPVELDHLSYFFFFFFLNNKNQGVKMFNYKVKLVVSCAPAWSAIPLAFSTSFFFFWH